MSDQASDAELDARMLRELREWRRSPSVVHEIERGRQVWLDPEELDLLLRIADERDALKREACAEPGERVVPIFASIPDEIRARVDDEVGRWPCLVCLHPIRRADLAGSIALGQPYYVHVDPSVVVWPHDAVRGPDSAA